MDFIVFVARTRKMGFTVNMTHTMVMDSTMLMVCSARGFTFLVAHTSLRGFTTPLVRTIALGRGKDGYVLALGQDVEETLLFVSWF